MQCTNIDNIKIANEPAHEKRDLMVFRSVVLQIRSPLFQLQTCFLPEASFHKVSTTSVTSKDCSYAYAFAGCVCGKYLSLKYLL